MIRTGLSFICAVFLAFSAAAETRLALVIGNSNYAQGVGRLANPGNDARLVAGALEQVGFEVTTLYNQDVRGIKRALRDHRRKVRAAGSNAISFFYYSGHGAADEDANFLIPIGAEIASRDDLAIEGVGVAEIVSAFSDAKANFVVMDACRDFPFSDATSRSLHKGFQVERERLGTLIAFATSPGDVATDVGQGGGPYARALAAELTAPGADHWDLFKSVQTRVYDETGGTQTPWVRDGVVGRFLFSAASSTAPVNTPPLDVETQAFIDAQDCADYRAYLNRFPNGKYRGQMEALLAARPCAVATTPRPVTQSVSAEEASEAYYKGRAAYQREDYQVARGFYEIACNGGDVRGCTNLGFLYHYGNGVSQDYARARALYQQGCDGGEAGGCANLGFLYEKGLGVSQDYARAAALYQQGCDGGDALGCTNLGYLYHYGNGVSQDYDRARALYQQSCDSGHALGCTNLGVLYGTGLGVSLDYARARALYEQGCDGGNATGCSSFGNYLYKGLGGSTDRIRGAELLRQGCADGNPWGCDRLDELGLSR